MGATDCVAKEVTDPAKCNLLAEKVSDSSSVLLLELSPESVQGAGATVTQASLLQNRAAVHGLQLWVMGREQQGTLPAVGGGGEGQVTPGFPLGCHPTPKSCHPLHSHTGSSGNQEKDRDRFLMKCIHAQLREGGRADFLGILVS